MTGLALRRLVAVACAFATIAAIPARGALFDDDEARRRIDATNAKLAQVQKQLDDRITTIEAQLRNQGLVELFGQVEQLKTEIARLRGQIEVLVHEQDEQQKRQRDLYIDLDSRLRKLEGVPGTSAGSGATEGAAPAATPAPAAAAGAQAAVPSGAAPAVAARPGAVAATNVPPAAPARPGAAPADPASEQRAYDAALDQFRNRNYAASITGFASFVKAYPKSALAPSAQYWIGNAQFAQKDYRAAIASQRQLIAAYPSDPKVPDAMLAVASSQFELGDTAASRRTLEDLVAKYPKSEAATKARQRLAAK